MKIDNKVVFIVGPSGIGKTTILKHAAEGLGYTPISLDELVAEKAKEQGFISKGGAYEVLKKLGSEGFCIFGLRCLFGLVENKDKNEKVLIDVGAAFQNNKIFSAIPKVYYMICISAEPQAAFDRYKLARSDERSFSSHCLIEFSPVRIDVYNSSDFLIDTTWMDRGQSFSEFKDIVMKIEGFG